MKNYTFSKIVFTLVFVKVCIVQNLQTQPFVEQTSIVLPGVQFGSIAWGDYDNDGDLDILLTGSNGINYISRIYRNNGPSGTGFTEQTDITLPEVPMGSAAWGDYDNDGFLDILLIGNIGTKIYHNNGNNTFTGISFTGPSSEKALWGDYDNDGDPDILITGISSTFQPISKIIRNSSNNTFTEQTDISLTGVWASNAAWGDYDKDGDLDIVIMGDNNGGLGFITKIYRNNGNGTFSYQTNISLTGVQSGSVIWGDYDNDGYLDILLSGQGGSTPVTKIYKNNGNNTFSEQKGISLTKVQVSSTAWGDYNNDGNLDILLAGNISFSNPVSKIYKNNGNNSFTEQTDISLTGVDGSSVAWGDYDNDGDLDILLTGHDINDNYLTKIYRNDITTANTPPDAPNSLNTTIIDSTVILSWNSVKTDSTPYKGMTYNLRVGTTPGASDIVSPQSLPNGYRLIPAMGNAQLDTFFILKNLSEGTYYWSVQAVDNGFLGGAFAEEGTFIILEPLSPEAPTNPIVDDTANTFDWTYNPKYVAITEYEYSVDNGTTWTTCTTKPLNVGNVILAAGYVKVRIKATPTTQASEPLSSNTAYNLNTGFNDQTENKIDIFPNPVTDILIIQSTYIVPNTCISIYSISGQEVFKSVLKASKTEIDLHAIPAGVYVYKLVTNDKLYTDYFTKE